MRWILTEIAAPALFGAFAWTWIEYVVHGPLGHRLKGNVVARLHGMHHREPRLVFVGPAWIPLAAATAALYCGIAGPLRGGVAAGATIGGFLYYEYVHWRFHFRLPTSLRERALRAHHLAHHHQDPRFGHGVSSRIWDYVFGTLSPKDTSKFADYPPLTSRYGFLESFLSLHGIRTSHK